ncbi:MAG TPA: hypothetical protein PLX85_05890, partial [Dehalococcoidia bacterium]|nr:hypothetical protein [Dehalococcoidia bacterium]
MVKRIEYLKRRGLIPVLTVAAILAVIGGATMVSAHGGDTTKVHVCVPTVPGQPILASTANATGPNNGCFPGYVAADFSTGPAGPSGATGPTGPSGAIGA